MPKTRETATVKDAATATIVVVSATTGVRVTVVIVMIAATKANVKTANVRRVAMRVATNPAVIVRPRGAIAAANATNHHARTNRMRQSSPPAGHQSKHQRHRHATSNHARPWKHGHQRRAKMVKAVAAVVVAEVDVVAVDVS